MIKERLPNYTQVCVFPALLVDENKIQEEFIDQFKEVFDWVRKKKHIRYFNKQKNSRNHNDYRSLYIWK